MKNSFRRLSHTVILQETCLALFSHQVSGIQASEIVQRQHPHRFGLAEAALLHRPRRRHVSAYIELYAKFPAADTRQLRRPGSAAGGGAILRHST